MLVALAGNAFGTEPVCIAWRKLWPVRVHELGPSVNGHSLTHPTNHMVRSSCAFAHSHQCRVLLCQSVVYAVERDAMRMLVALAGNAVLVPSARCVMCGASYLYRVSKLGAVPARGHFAHTTQQTTWEVELFRFTRPIVEVLAGRCRAVLSSGFAMPC